MALDDLDKKILQHLSTGISSYEELARACDVTRNTVYRRIASLENKGIIKNTVRCIVNFDQLDITPVIIEAVVPVAEQDRVFNLLTENANVRFLWRTFGDHNVALVAFCPRGDEGALIQEIKAILESLNVTNLTVSTGFVWEKMELSPFSQETEIEKKIALAIERRCQTF